MSNLKYFINDADASNWMRFVRPALTCKEQNLVICQQRDGIVFLTTRSILPKEELKAGPSTDYAIRRNLIPLKSTQEIKDDKGIYSLNNIWIFIYVYAIFNYRAQKSDIYLVATR